MIFSRVWYTNWILSSGFAREIAFFRNRLVKNKRLFCKIIFIVFLLIMNLFLYFHIWQNLNKNIFFYPVFIIED